MLPAQLEDWLTKFREADLRLPFYDKEGKRIPFEQVLAEAPANAAEIVTPEAITARFRAMERALEEVKRRVEAAKLDVLIVLGDDQHELFRDTNMPAIGIYYGETIRNAVKQDYPEEDQWYKRAQMRRLEDREERNYPCDAKLALHLISGLRDRDFDISAVGGLESGQYEGHAYSFVHKWFLRDVEVPIIPVFLNTYYDPNQPHPRRCVALGKALKEAIADYPKDIRVGLMASGGLSHFRVEEDIDRGLLEAFRRKDLAYLAALDPRRLKAGSSEIRNWIAVGAAANDLDVKWTDYVPGYRTLALTGTGLGFAEWG
jgi:3-O-methylgallate 3,4-dioxygenase